MQLKTSFRTKLLLLTIVPLAVAQVVTLLAVMRTVENDIRSDARESLTIGAGVVNEYLESRTDQLRTSVGVLAADYGLKEATATNDAATIRSVLDNHGRRVGADLAALVDLDGNVVASTLDPTNASYADVTHLIAAASRQQQVSAAFLSDAAYQLFSVPLRAPVTVGWVVLGFRIDDALAGRIADLTGLDVTILHRADDRVELITTQSADPAGIDAHRRTDAVYMASEDTNPSLTIQTPFLHGDPSVLVVLQRSMREAMQPYAEARRGLIVFGAVLLVFVAVAGGWFSTTIARPLRTLGAAARRMIAGDYERSVDVKSDDEFGELASSFNAMQTAIAEREQRITHNALHDPLTDLPNRASVLKSLTLMIERARRSDSRVAILSIRLLRMNEITSTLGHNATDELIRTTARHLLANVGGGQMLGQTGTNEFVLLLPGDDVEGAISQVDRIENLLGSGVTLGRVNIILQTQVGIAEFPRHGDAAADLLRFASIARTEAETRNERYRVYQAGHEDQFVRRLRIVNDLPAALRRGDVETWFQPKVSLPDTRVCGAEALVRWQHRDLGRLNPDDFVPAAEQSGTIVALTRHVIAEAVRQCRSWEDAGHELQVSANLAARDLLDEYLPYHVMQILKEHGLPAQRLTLEVTENSIMEDLQKALSVLDCLRDVGVRISMDDFGTGHSSLAQLRNIPLDELKIDKCFVTTLCNDRHNDAIVRTAVELAHSMHLGVVAEGVEDEPTLRRVAEIGCQQAQGYHMSTPLAAQDFLAWLRGYEPKPVAERRGGGRAFAS
ncbi:MAG: EAL domain-containing protein [Woeseiaceae bacterium]